MKLTTALVLLPLLLLPLSASGYVGYDDAGDPLYGWSDTAHPADPDTPTYAYSSISGTGTAVSFMGTDSAGPFALPFTFEFFETPYSQVYLSGYGLLGFGPVASAWSPTTIPSTSTPHNFVAGAWMSWDTWSTSAWYATRGTAPNREFVAQWRGAYWDWDVVYVDFQVVLHESGDIAVYVVDGSRLSWSTAYVGIENADGRRGAQAYGSSASALVAYAATFDSLGERPRIAVRTSALTVPEGGSIVLEIDVTDRQDDLDTVTWDLDGDGEFDDDEGETVTISAEGVDGPDVLSPTVRAVDLAGNERIRVIEIQVTNVAPRILNSPVTQVLRGELWEFIAEIVDPGGDRVVVSAPTRPNGMTVLGSGGVRWQPTDDDVGDHDVVLVATDDDGDATTLAFTLTVLENTAPGQPGIIQPRMNEVLDTLRPTFIVTTPDDPEGDQLTLTFDIDTSDTFDSPRRVTSGPISVSLGQTGWTATTDLEDGRNYWWRVRAFDGHDWGPAARGRFSIDVGGGGGEDAGPDGGEDGGVHPPVVSGCECRAGGTGSAAALPVSLLLLALVLGRLGPRRR